jgi:hypothetical protein
MIPKSGYRFSDKIMGKQKTMRRLFALLISIAELNAPLPRGDIFT